MNWNPEELSYLAGIIDGEGCIGVQRIKDRTCRLGYNRRPYLQICNTDEALIEWCRNFFNNGFSSVLTKKNVCYRSFRYPLFRVTISSNTMRELLPRLMPYFIVKKEQAEVMLKILELLKTNQWNRHYQELEFLMTKLRKLKHRHRIGSEQRGNTGTY